MSHDTPESLLTTAARSRARAVAATIWCFASDALMTMGLAATFPGAVPEVRDHLGRRRADRRHVRHGMAELEQMLAEVAHEQPPG